METTELNDLLPVTVESEDKTAVNTACVVIATVVATTLGWIGVGYARTKIADWRNRRAERTVVHVPAPEEGE